MRKPLKTFVARYRHHGRWYTVDIEASSWADAQERVTALAWARLDGLLIARFGLPAQRFIQGLVRRLRRAIRAARWAR
jgi:hypothetical protein